MPIEIESYNNHKDRLQTDEQEEDGEEDERLNKPSTSMTRGCERDQIIAPGDLQLMN